MSELSKQALKVENNTSFPNNNSGEISAADLRAFNVDMIDSLVDEITYNVDSASWNQQITALEQFTSSQQPSFTALNQFTASQLTINSGVNAFTQSANARLNALESETANLEAFTASVNQIADNGVVQGTSTRLHFYGLVSASIVPNVNGPIASINIEQDGTKLNSASFNAYTASTDSDLTSIHQTTQSLNDFTASLTTAFVSTASFNAYTQSINSYTSSNNDKWSNLGSQSGSWITESESGSFLITASFNNGTRNLTFTKGDSTTFAVNIPDVSGSTGNFVTTSSFNAYTASNDSKVNSLIAATASYAISSSVAAVDAAQQAQINALINATASYATSAITASSLITASVNLNTITFTKGDGSTFPITVNTGSGGGGGSIDTGSFAITGSNIFKGNQSIDGNVLISGSDLNHLLFSRQGGSDILSIGVSDNAQTYEIKLTGSANQTMWLIDNQGGTRINTFATPVIAADWLRVESTFTASLQEGYAYVGNASGKTSAVPTSSFGGGSTNTGSFLVTSSFIADKMSFTKGDSTTYELAGIVNTGSSTIIGTMTFSADANAQARWNLSGSEWIGMQKQVGLNRLIWVDNNNEKLLSLDLDTDTFSVSGSFNAKLQQGYAWVGDSNNRAIEVATSSFAGATINTGSFATTGSNVFTGDQTLVDAAGNSVTLSDVSGSLMLVAKTFTSASTHLTSSANSFTNLIFKNNNNTADTIISGSNNLFVNPSAPTAGFKRFVGTTGNIALNASNVPQISSSMAFPITINNNILTANGTTITMRGPVSSSTWNIGGNVIAGAVAIGTAAAQGGAQSIVAGANITQNTIPGTLNILAGQTGVNFNQTATISANYIAGTSTLTMTGSVIAFNNNIVNDSGTSIINGYYSSSIGLGSLAVNRNNFAGQVQTISVSGSFPAGATFTGPSYSDNAMFGGNNTIFCNVSAAPITGGVALHSALRNIVGGHQLIITGSSNLTLADTYGSAFFGRWNANDGVRNRSGQNVFVVGTGINETGRKTGFLIDSGSNTFVEGTFNVSGSSTLSGSLYIQSGSTLPVSTGSAILTWDATTGQVKQASYSTIISSSVSSAEFWSTTTQSGSAGVSGSITFNNSGSFYNVSLVNGTQLTVANAGVYNIQFSAQIETSAGADTLWIWFKKNGTNIGDSASKAVLANNTAQIMTVNILDQANANDYYEIAYQNLNGHATVLAEAASGNIPAIPSVIATIYQIR